MIRYDDTAIDELIWQTIRDSESTDDFRNYLNGSGSDFQKEYADELRVVRQRKLPK